MYAHQVRKALREHPITRQQFRDVRPADRLPKRHNQHGIYVVNTQPAWMHGEHWTTVEYGPTHVYYFDPYGGPPHPTIMKHLLGTGALKGKKLFYFPRRLQGYRNTCGLYCIYHTLTRSTNQYSLDIFNTDLAFNDRLVHNLVTKMFNVNKSFKLYIQALFISRMLVI